MKPPAREAPDARVEEAPDSWRAVQATSYRLTVHGIKDCPQHPYERLGLERKRFGVEIEVAAAAPLVVDPHYASLKDEAGGAYRATFGGCQPDLRYTRLATGGRVRGWVSFEVPVRARGFELSYNPQVGDAGRTEPVATKL